MANEKDRIMTKRKNIEIEFEESGIVYRYVALGNYENGQDGIYRYWPNEGNKKNFYDFLSKTDLCIVLFTIGQQANLGYLPQGATLPKLGMRMQRSPPWPKHSNRT
jgi:hypothetical protein